jgi:hypothetical protein
MWTPHRCDRARWPTSTSSTRTASHADIRASWGARIPLRPFGDRRPLDSRSSFLPLTRPTSAPPGAQRAHGWLARMGRGNVPQAEASVGGRRHLALRDRRVRCHVRGDIRLAASRALEEHRPSPRPGAIGTTGNNHAADSAGRVARTVHDHVDRRRACRALRLPRAPAPAAPAVSPAVAPVHSRDVAAGGHTFVPMDVTPGATGGEGYVDLGMGQHRRWRR